jgi:hypothetical protein
VTAKDEALAALAAHKEHAAKVRAQLDEDDIKFVAACRDAGATWQAIADVLEKKQSDTVRKYKPKLTTETRVRPKTNMEEAS